MNRLPPIVLLALALLTGLLVSLPFVNDAMAFTAWGAFVPLLFVVEAAPVRRCLLAGWIAGTATHLVGFYWIPGLLVRFGELPLAAGVAGWILLAAWGGVMYALVALVASLLHRRRSGLPPLMVLPFVYVAVEFVFPHVFPWTLAGAQYRSLPFIQAAEVTGVLGLSGLIVLASAALYELVAPRSGFIPAGRIHPWWALLALGLVAGVFALGQARLGRVREMRSAAPPLTVGVVQPNVAMDDEGPGVHDDERLDELQRLSARAQSRGAELVIWPETSYPYRIHRAARTDSFGRRRIVRGFSVPVLFGAVSFDESGRYNSAFLAMPGGDLVGPADKNHLVLFSERIPGRRWIPSSLKRRSRLLRGGFQAGAVPGVIRADGVRIGILNCFEDTIRSYGRAVVREGADLLVNITNDAWFGDTAEPHQHLALSVFRAVETRRDLVRSVNTGVSAVVLATGEIESETETFRQAVLVEQVRLLSATTPYTRGGDWLGWASLGVLVIAGLWTTIRTRRAAARPGADGREHGGGLGRSARGGKR